MARILVALLLLASTVAWPPTDRESPARLVDERVQGATALFESAGLQLPEVDVVFSDDAADCRGHLGFFDPALTPWRVWVCSELEFVLTHELAHAWIEANVDGSERDAYTEFRGFESWYDASLAWNERALEDAAFVIQQNVMMVDVRLESSAWQERIVAYEMLTGLASPLGS